MEILKIHAAGIAKHGEIDYEAVVKLAEVSTKFLSVFDAFILFFIPGKFNMLYLSAGI